MKTLAYDCGNPVQYVCGRMPAVLFYLLDRHALLAMTMGSKCGFLGSLTTPALRATPPMEGNLIRSVAEQSSPLWRGGALCATGWSLIEILHFCPGADDVCVDCSTSFYFVVAGQAVYHNINRNFGGIGTDFFFEI